VGNSPSFSASKKATARIEAAFEQAGIHYGGERRAHPKAWSLPSRQGRRGGGKLAGGCRHATLDLPRGQLKQAFGCLVNRPNLADKGARLSITPAIVIAV
jgi:hypothetical protein